MSGTKSKDQDLPQEEKRDGALVRKENFWVYFWASFFSHLHRSQIESERTGIKNGRWQNSSELFLVGGIFSLGILILVIHLTTWGRSVWEESEGLVRSTATVQERYIHARPNQKGILYYRPEVLIVYEANGRPYAMRAYERRTLTEDQGFLYDKQTAQEMLDLFPREAKVPCWYSSEHPERVLLVKDNNIWGWIFLIIPVILISFGVCGLVVRIRYRMRSEEQRAIIQKRKSIYPTVPNSGLINESPGIRLSFRLPLTLFPMFHFLFVFFLMLLWNGVSWAIFIYLISHRTGWIDLINAILFGGIFCGAGLVFLPRITRLFKRSFAVGTTILEISDHPVIPTRKHRLSLIQYGRLTAKSYRISAVSEEIARFRQGTDTITNHREVFRQILFEKNDINIPAGQSLSEDFFLRLPCGVMHSMSSEHNEIRWKLIVEITISESSVYCRECPLIVLPYTIRSEIYT
ncbi:MAG: hypothetical protein Q4G69_04710 [Planctomycetia bacterium]|nr:hypothetical protein [Planctomycetia bacterium]